MKKILRVYVCLVILSIGIAGCKKNDDPESSGSYYIRFKVDGVQKEYSGEVPNNYVVYSPNSGAKTYTCTLTAVNSTADATASPSKNLLTIVLYSNDPIVTGKEYQLQDPINVSTIPIASMIINYHDENGKSFVASVLQSTPPSSKLHDAGQITFSQISDAESKGTFSGVVTHTDDKALVNITDGEFHLKDAKALQ